MESYREVIDRLTRAHPSLSPQVRKASAYVLENPGEVATLSMRKLAAAAEVPPPTLPRLARALGFETYDSFREVYRRRLQQSSAVYSAQAGLLQRRREGGSLPDLPEAFRAASLRNIEQLFQSLDERQLEGIARTLIDARRVYVVGMQASFAFANYLHYVAHMAFSSWTLVRNANGVLADWVIELGPEDVLVAIALDPCARDTVRLAQMARERGATVVGITNTRTTPLAAKSDHLLLVPSQSPQFFESYVSTTVLLETLIGLIVAESGEEVVGNIEEMDRSRRELGEYWDRRAEKGEGSP